MVTRWVWIRFQLTCDLQILCEDDMIHLHRFTVHAASIQMSYQIVDKYRYSYWETTVYLGTRRIFLPFSLLQDDRRDFPDLSSFSTALRIHTTRSIIEREETRYSLLPSILLLNRGLTMTMMNKATRRPTRMVVTNLPHSGIRSKYNTETEQQKPFFSNPIWLT